MIGRRAVAVVTMSILLLTGVSVFAQKNAGARRPAPAARGAVVARVGKIDLTQTELDARTQQAVEAYRKSSGNRTLPPEMMDMLRRQMLETMIRLQLLAQEAARTGVRGGPGEAENELRKAPLFNVGGRFDPSRFEEMRTKQRPAFDAAVGAIDAQLGARKLYASLVERFQPSEGEARSAAERALARVVVEALPLKTPDFPGTFPEPREMQVLDYYRSHMPDWRRAARASITVAFVDAPEAVPTARTPEERSAKLKALAEAALRRIAAGAPFDTATAAFGERASIIVTSDNFPGYWRASAEQSAGVFDPRNTGRTLPVALASERGWLIVRVDAVVPAHIAPLREVAQGIREALRRDVRIHHEEDEQRALYAAVRDSLAGPGWSFRWAAIDTSSFPLPAPTQADLERWYHAHQADYSTFDAATGAITTRPLADVAAEVRERYLRDARAAQGRDWVDRVQSAWATGKRDAEAEARVGVRETPPLVQGAVIDTGLAAGALADTLWRLPELRGNGVVPWRRGWIVWTILDRVEHVVPTFEQARVLVAYRLQQRRTAEEIEGARAMFATDSMRFNRGDVVHFTRVIVPLPPVLKVPLTRAEVEKWHHDHLDKYVAPELVTARHILVRVMSRAPEADSAARHKAEDLLARVKAGENFQELAKQYSEDPATKDAGGDLGAFGRGTMLAAFEKAAFALNAGELCDHPVRTEVGWHIIYCVDHVPAFVHSMPTIYGTVAGDAAQAKSIELAHARADSLLALGRTPEGVRRLAEQQGIVVLSQQHETGIDMNNPVLKGFYDPLFKLQPGQMLPAPFAVKGEGWWIGWVDSVTAPVAPKWEDVRTQVLADYRHGTGRRARAAKRAELDSLFAAGWSLDSLGALWGGLERAADVTPGHGLPGMGSNAAFDSTVFGARGLQGLALNTPSPWLTLPNGSVKIRVTDHVPPPADHLAARAAAIRAAELERHLRAYFEDLHQRYPVRILDGKLRDMQLAEPPPGLTQ